MERKVDQLPLEAPQFAKEVWRRHWSKLTTYPAPANNEVAKEFYANARVYSEEEEPFMSYVRGKRVPFDAVIINSFFNNQWSGDRVRCKYVEALKVDFEGTNFGEVEHAQCVPGGYFQRKRQGQPLHIRRSFLSPICKYWVMFIHVNLSPFSNVSDLTTSRAFVICFILQGKQINAGQLIAQEINDYAHSANSKSPLGYPSLITYLCELAGVDSSTPLLRGHARLIGPTTCNTTCLMRKVCPSYPQSLLDPKGILSLPSLIRTTLWN